MIKGSYDFGIVEPFSMSHHLVKSGGNRPGGKGNMSQFVT